jgi:pantoate--beta-alanine ligase
MLIFTQVNELQNYLELQRKLKKKIGFAPTMGALHEGHLSLVEKANKECGVSVVSIFVNPTQFNDPKDLEKYPRTPEKDAALLETVDCDVLFMPTVDAVYPSGQDFTIKLDFKQLEKVMEGEFRPGHFAGMATVVNRLLDIVKPDNLYMGQKDYQQQAIVRDMLRQQNSKITLKMCPTLREADGLAMSSRNVRLTPRMRDAAPVIFQTLTAAKKALKSYNSALVKGTAFQKMEAAGLHPEYFEIVDGNTLMSVRNFEGSDFIVACMAAFAGDVRLIDNLVLKGKA